MPTLFISDLHLSPERPELSRALLRFLEEIGKSCDALYLLGDIFDAWIGDDFRHPALSQVFEALQHFGADTPLFFQHGNRDFLVGKALCRSINAQLLPEEQVITLPDGQNALLMHGDQLCTDDTEYQNFRHMVRNPQWQNELLARPIEERLAIARELRAASKEKNTVKASSIMDVNEETVREALNRHDTTLLIHGHTHRPAVHEAQTGTRKHTRIVLGDWTDHFWYLSCGPDGCQLIKHDI